MIVLARIYINLASIWVDVNQILILVAILSLLVGCLGAIRQDNIKRMLAYSSIGHVGFILAGLAALSLDSIKAAILYMIIYSSLALGSFAFLILLKNKNSNSNFDQKNDQLYKLSSIAGIGKSNPIIAMCLAILMFSMAGIPPMAGFFAKFYILMAVIKKGFYTLAVIAVLASVISAFYYLRIVKIMYFDNKDENTEVDSSNNAVISLVLMALVSILFMGYMKPFLSLIAGIF
jgi:NADH-quinone oxidoreductase subunit N